MERIRVWSLVATAKSLQSCPTLCDPIDGSPPGFPVPGILQARILEWVAISFSNAWKWKVKGKSLSHVWLLMTPWAAAYQAPPFMGFSRQVYWSGVPLPSPILWLMACIKFLLLNRSWLLFSWLNIDLYTLNLIMVQQRVTMGDSLPWEKVFPVAKNVNIMF